MKDYIKKYLPALILTILLISLDQITKAIARNELTDRTVIILEGIFEFKLVFNTGVAWGMFNSSQYFVSILSILIMILVLFVFIKIPYEKKRLRPLGIMLILIFSGAVGNLTDRIFMSSVTDFLYFKLINFPIFNVADIYITVSGIVTAILLIFYYKEDDLDFLKFRKKK